MARVLAPTVPIFESESSLHALAPPMRVASCVKRADERLCSLLDDEYFLYKILGHLVKDGLHECRRVCRKWNDVCRRLPIKLAWVPINKLRELPEKFPYAASVSVYMEDDDECVAAVKHLDAMRNLKCLEWASARPWCGVMNSMEAGTASFSWRFDRLESLSVMLHSEDVASWFSLALRRLTQLSSLALEVVGGVHTRLEPFTELSRVKSLDIPSSFLINIDGHFLFPSIKNLEKLWVHEEDKTPCLTGSRLLEIMSPYTTSLRSLTLCLDEDCCVSRALQPLRSFTKLETLLLSGSMKEASKVFRALNDIESLTELDIAGVVPFTSQESVDALFSLSALRSLSFAADPSCTTESNPFSFPFSRLTQLTHLSAENMSSAECLSGATRLVNVQLSIHENVCSHVLNDQKSAEDLLVTVDYESQVLCDVLADLKQLRSLDLSVPAVPPAANFIPKLAELADLTQLVFSYGGHGKTQMSLSAISKLSSLRTLGILTEEAENPLEYLIEGSFPRLRALSVAHDGLADDEKEELRRRFPCLNTIQTS